MTSIASRDLRNHTSRVLQEVERGGTVTITVQGRAVAELSPVRDTRPTFMPRHQLAAVLSQADPRLRQDLAALVGDTTDDLGDLP